MRAVKELKLSQLRDLLGELRDPIMADVHEDHVRRWKVTPVQIVRDVVSGRV
jgi:hypothetical protein